MYGVGGGGSPDVGDGGKITIPAGALPQLSPGPGRAVRRSSTSGPPAGSGPRTPGGEGGRGGSGEGGRRGGSADGTFTSPPRRLTQSLHVRMTTPRPPASPPPVLPGLNHVLGGGKLSSQAETRRRAMV